MRRLYIYGLLLLLLSSCRQGKTEQKVSVDKEDATFCAVVLPEIPVMLTAPEQRAEYLAKHYWDDTAFNDTNYVSHHEQVEQAWVDYLAALSNVPLEVSQESMRRFFGRILNDQRFLEYFAELADKYLYDPNSPMRNEELYIPVLEAVISSPALSDIEKVRPEYRLELAKRNRLGTRAINFTYTLDSGATGTLYRIPTDYTLLFINNPGCNACAETIGLLKESDKINILIKEGKLTVLSFYPDEDLDEWKKHKTDFPAGWINSYDKEFLVKNKNYYDLKAIPTLYLLDKDKVVLLKDAPLQTIELWLSQNVR